MKFFIKYTKALYLICCCILFINCGKQTPEEYFSIAVLNTNMFSGFANNGMLRQLDSPSSKLNENNEEVAVKRSEVVSTKVQFIEENFEKIKKLKETDDTKDMLSSSIALYEFVLPVYKNEYMQLAELYDTDAGNNQTEKLSELIQEKYSSRYKELYNKLISTGKSYAEKHSIKVHWNE